MPSLRPAALLLPLLLALATACPGRTEDPTPAPPAPQLPALALPDGAVSALYSASLEASGGTPPLRYVVDGLPPGLTYDLHTGALSGRPTQSGSFEVHAAVVDARGASDGHAYALQVFGALQVTTATLPRAQVGTAYAAQLQASAAQGALAWSVVGGALPEGLALDAQGRLAGTPQSAGSASFTVQAKDASGAVGQRALTLSVIAAGTRSVATLVANWNLEWFGADKDSNGNELGPADEALQLSNVRDVMLGVDADIWALQEVVSPTAFEQLTAQLPGYAGFVSNDASVPDGSWRYSPSEQKLALLYRSDRVQVLGAQLVRVVDYVSDPYQGSEDYKFAGRPPLRVDLRVSEGDVSSELTVIVVHLKAHASDDALASWQRRRDAAALIKAYVDRDLSTRRVLVLGDWNDDLDTSIASGNPTPFQAFLDDAADYTYLTRPFTLARQGTTVRYPDAIDHQLASNELVSDYVAGSASIVKPGITGYGNNTSDHYPITSRFELTAP